MLFILVPGCAETGADPWKNIITCSNMLTLLKVMLARCNYAYRVALGILNTVVPTMWQYLIYFRNETIFFVVRDDI